VSQSEVQQFRIPGQLAAAAHPSFILLSWEGGPTLEAIDLVNDMLRPYEERGDSIDFVAVIPAQSDYPSEEARRKLAESMRSAAIRNIALVTQGKGFRASIVRSILSSISLMTRKSIPQKVVSTVEEGERWLVELGAEYPVGEISSVHSSLQGGASARSAG
jgi:hypothetical protein